MSGSDRCRAGRQGERTYPLAAVAKALERAGEDQASSGSNGVAAPVVGRPVPSDVPSVLQHAVEEAARLVGASGGVICVLDPETAKLRYAHEAVSSRRQIRFWARSVEVNDGTGLIARSMSERRLLVTGDYVADRSFTHAPSADRVITRLGYRSLLVAPLLIEDRAIGVLSVFSGRWEAFNEDHMALVGALADHAAGAIANAQLIADLAESREQLAHRVDAQRTLSEIAARLTSIRQPDELLQYAVSEATRLLDADGGLIDRVDEEGWIRWGFGAGVMDEAVREILRNLELRVGEGLFGLAVAEREIQLTGDYEADARFVHAPGADEVVRRIGIRSLIAAPLIADDEALGVLGIYSNRPDFFDDDDVELLALFADHASVAIANSRLIDELASSQAELEHRAEAERSLREITERIAAIRDPDEVLQRIVDEAQRLLRTDGAHLTLMSDDRTHLRPVVVAGTADESTRQWLQEQKFPLHGGMNGLAAGLGRSLWTADYLTDPRVPHEADDQLTAARLGLRAMAVAPLRAPEGEIAGTLAISWRTAREVSDEEIDLLQVLADQAAIALAAARLDSLLRESEGRYRHLVENSPDLVWAIDESARFTFVSDTCERLTGWKPEELIGGHFRSIVHPSSADVADRDWTAGIPEGSHELRGRLNLLHRDGHSIPAEFLARATILDGRFVGANGSVRDMTERDRLEVELRRQAAALAAGDERAHLARELHDSVTQALFSMTLITRSIEVLLGRDPDAAAEKIATLRDLQRDALAEMRALIFELRPGSLEQDGLVHALRTHTAAVQGRIGLPIMFESDLADRLPAEVEDALYRIGQEALHNVVKHAAAREVRVELKLADEGVRLLVADDGTGFDAAKVPTGHLGLAGMRVRAEKIGAVLQVRPTKGKGTTVAVLAPVRPSPVEEPAESSVPA
jgi:PAS domain S-box-containing protein